MIEETNEMAEALPVEIEAAIDAAPEEAAEETFEEREARLKREDYARRNLQAIKDREDVYRRNKLIKDDEPFVMDPDASVNQWCCS